MRVGMIGLGKLGLPVAYAMAARGADVYGYDPAVTGPPTDTSHEEGYAATIATAGERMRFASLDAVVSLCDVVFCAVATPHEPRFEGVTPLPAERVDFDYSHLRAAVAGVVDAARRLDRRLTLAVISTVLPGTMSREIRPLLDERVQLAYNPSFIAMGTTIADFLDPEFVLLGGDESGVVDGVYRALGIERVRRMSVESAELTKVAYNTFIGLKLAFANTLLEVCHKTPGTDVDEVTSALRMADRRLISGAYLDAGMGDGGGCHPRDNIALSWLARELGLSFDLFEAAMQAREEQTRWLVRLVDEHRGGLPFGLLGLAYKPGSHIITGSPALLYRNFVEAEHGECFTYDPYVPGYGALPGAARAFLVGCRHPEFPQLRLPEGSVVIDPWRYMPDQDGVTVVRVGQHHAPRCTPVA